MRVAFYGNVCNVFYQIAKALRAGSDIDAHLFVNANDHMQWLPESDDPEVLADPPAWIHRGHYRHRGWYATPWASSLVAQLREFDLIVVGGEGPIIAQFAGKPMVFWASGSDLTASPFPLRFLYLYPSWIDRLGLLLKGFWQRRALHRMREIWAQPLDINVHAIRDLRIGPDRVSKLYFPVVIDTRKMALRTPPRSIPPELRFPPNAPKPFLVFHPTRIRIDDHSRKGAEGQSKGNLVLLEGFARFARNPAVQNAYLVLVDRDVFGDNPKAKRWIAQAGIEDRVIWLKPPQPAGYPRNTMVDLYSLCDVVADQFGNMGGGFGCIGLEACACSRPVLIRTDETLLSRLYPWHPLLGASTPDDIAARLADLYANPALREEAGSKGRRWIEQFHSPEKAGPAYAARLRDLCRDASAT